MLKNNVVACKLPFTSHLSNRRRHRMESESTHKIPRVRSSLKTRKVNQKLRTIVQKLDDIVEEEPCQNIFEEMEFNIIKEQFKANKRNYLSQMLQKYDDTPLDANKMLITLIQELTSEKYNDDKNKEQIVKEYKSSQEPLRYMKTTKI